MKEFKIRPSAIGLIMTEPRLKKDKEAGNLSKTCKSYLQKWYLETRWNKVKEFTNKFTEKGIEVEDEAIELYSRVSGRDFLKKNEETLENDFCVGTPDIRTDIVIDVKSSWDAHTFPFFEDEIPIKLYWWQLQGYMWLDEKQNAELAYCLVNTPESLILKQANTEKWNAVGVLTDSEQEALYSACEKNMTFDDIPEKLRVKIYPVDRDEESIEAIKSKVLKCREYLSEIHAKLS